LSIVTPQKWLFLVVCLVSLHPHEQHRKNQGTKLSIPDPNIEVIPGNMDHWLVVEPPTPLKNMSSSVGMMKFPIYGKIKAMFQTTNQY
jgi:hypothetical protein